MKRIELDCPAKINLFLEITGRRPDGFHEIVTVMAPIDLADTLEISEAREFSLEVEGARLEGMNTVEKAYRSVARRRNIAPVRARLVKRIPAGTGLGGGSSDAAAMIEALDALFELGLDRAEAGADVGSDVNFFFAKGPALCTGRGEIVHPLRARRRIPAAILFPPFPNPTKEVYLRLNRARDLTGPRRNVSSFLNTWEGGLDVEVSRALYNRLEAPAFELRPELRTWLARLGGEARMTGSGSAVYRLNPDRYAAEGVMKFGGRLVSTV